MLTTSRLVRSQGFIDNDINKKIHNKLLMLCKAGHAVTYVKKAAEFDGHGAGQQLLLRYDGFSKQRQKSL
jgi:hypothetical protein